MNPDFSVNDSAGAAASAGVENIAASAILALPAGADGARQPADGSDGPATDEARVAEPAEATVCISVDDGNAPADDLPEPTRDTPATNADLALAPPAPRQTKEEHYRECLAALKANTHDEAASEGDARKSRTKKWVGIAILVRERGFDTFEFCKANGLPCTAATKKNPSLAVIKAVHPDVDAKVASKWAIGLKQAMKACGSLARLPEYLGEHSIDQCVKDARAAMRGERPARKARLTIIGAPSTLNGLVTMTVNVGPTGARFVSLATAEPSADTSVDTVAPPESDDLVEPGTEIAPALVEASSPGTSAGAHDGGDAGGDESIAEEVPMNA